MQDYKTSWSKLIATDMGEYVLERMSNPSLTYHNPAHIQRVYDQAASWELPYDANLDAAILWHDSVYDSRPNKEIRSVQLMFETEESMPQWFNGLDMDEIFDLILTTKDHKVTGDISSWLIKLDLADLAKPAQCNENFWNILRESCNLYDITPFDAARGTVDFMNNFKQTIQENSIADHDNEIFDDNGMSFWNAVNYGVTDTLSKAYTIIEFKEKNFSTY